MPGLFRGARDNSRRGDSPSERGLPEHSEPQRRLPIGNLSKVSVLSKAVSVLGIVCPSRAYFWGKALQTAFSMGSHFVMIVE